MSCKSDTVDTVERQRSGQSIVERNKEMIRSSSDIIGENESKMVLKFREYLVEVFFSSIHPLMVVRLVQFIKVPDIIEAYRLANNLNKDCIYGYHCFDIDKRRYYFQTSHWLDSVLSYSTFYELLNIYDIEAKKFLENL